MDDFTRIAAEKFAGDHFAVDTTGIVLEEARVGYARCRLDISERHLNMLGNVMGGAIFTLADFTFAVAAGCGDQPPTASLTSSIEFIASPHGAYLIAESECLKSGRSTCVIDVRITDAEQRLIAKVTTTGYRLGSK